jgi:hypothetical protein
VQSAWRKRFNSLRYALYTTRFFLMWTRRNLLKRWLWVSLIGSILNSSCLWKFVSTSWAKTKKLLSKGFPKDQIINMNPADIDNRNLEIDPLNQFGTMGLTDVTVDLKTYRLKLTGEVGRSEGVKSTFDFFNQIFLPLIISNSSFN